MDSKEYHSIIKFKFLRFAPLGENNAVDDEKRWIYRRALKYAQDRYKGRTNLDPNKDSIDQIFPEFIPLHSRKPGKSYDKREGRGEDGERSDGGEEDSHLGRGGRTKGMGRTTT